MNKLLIPLILLFYLQCFAQKTKEQATIDSLNHKINVLVKNDATKSHVIDSLQKSINEKIVTFDVKDWEKKKKVFENKTDWLSLFLTLLIPIIVLIGGSIYAIKQINKQGKWSLLQTKSNYIAQARINWIEELRKNLSEYVGLVAILNYYMREVVDLNKAKKKEEAEKIYIEQTERLRQLRQLSTEIKLRLNSDEENHKQLELNLDEYVRIAIEAYSKVTNDKLYDQVSDKVLYLSKIILKEAWGQAKNEGIDESTLLSKDKS